jgi:feruloyl esterase
VRGRSIAPPGTIAEERDFPKSRSLEEETMSHHRNRRGLSAFRTTAACVFAATALADSAFAATCESLTGVVIPFTTITTAQTVTGGTFTPPTGAAITGLPDFCRVALVMAPSADSSIRVEVWMPLGSWNGRYEGSAAADTPARSTIASLATALPRELRGCAHRHGDGTGDRGQRQRHSGSS